MIRSGYGRLLAAALDGILATPAVADERPAISGTRPRRCRCRACRAMPPQNTMQLCTAKEWTQPPPPPPGQTCTMSNFQHDGNKVSWDTQCTGQMDMTGHGEITFTSEDSYTGTITFTAEGMTDDGQSHAARRSASATTRSADRRPHARGKIT